MALRVHCGVLGKHAQTQTNSGVEWRHTNSSSWRAWRHQSLVGLGSALADEVDWLADHYGVLADPDVSRAEDDVLARSAGVHFQRWNAQSTP